MPGWVRIITAETQKADTKADIEKAEGAGKV